MGSKKVAIIGAGIAGLSLGCYLQKSGFSTEIYEANGKPGGLCTGWERDGYRIEGGLTGLWGSGPKHPFYKLYSELLDMEALAFSSPAIKTVYDFPDGKRFEEYADLGRLEQEMIEISPEDEGLIREWIADTRKITKIYLPIEKPKELYGLSERMRIKKGKEVLLLKKWSRMTSHDFSRQFKNPMISQITEQFRTPVLMEMFYLAGLGVGANGYPSGGASALAEKLAEQYESLGGTLHYFCRAQKIRVENRIAKGILFENGKSAHGDIIVSAMDGRGTLFDLLGGKFMNDQIRSLYEKPDLTPSVIQVAIGVRQAFEDEFPMRRIILDVPHELHDGSVQSFIEVMRFTQTVHGQKKTLFRVQMDTKFASYWWMLKKAEKERYKKEKREVAAWVADVLDSRVSPIKSDIEMMNVTTPATYIHLTGNWRGAVKGWNSKNIITDDPFYRELPELRNFYMAGQWVQPGSGIPMAFKSARDLAQLICKKEKKEFKPV
jgi:phytoene dehydrogenase-like protein